MEFDQCLISIQTIYYSGKFQHMKMANSVETIWFCAFNTTLPKNGLGKSGKTLLQRAYVEVKMRNKEWFSQRCNSDILTN